MEKFRVLFITLLLSLCMSSCSDDDNDTPKLSVDFLKQTGWTGTLESVVDGKVEGRYGITIYFKSATQGNYTMSSNYDFDEAFDYTIDDKLMKIIGHPGHVGTVGEWILLDIKNDKLLFRKGPTSDKSYYTLDLTKFGLDN